MSDPEYTPFPDIGLESLAKDYDSAAGKTHSPEMRDVWKHRADMLRSAILCHEALRERCLLAEMDRNQLQLKLEARSNAA